VDKREPASWTKHLGLGPTTATFPRLFSTQLRFVKNTCLREAPLRGAITGDKVAATKAEYARLGGMRSNARYGYIHHVNAQLVLPLAHAGAVASPKQAGVGNLDPACLP
jgi:hypothetical protein